MRLDISVTVQSPTSADITYDSEGIGSKAWTAVQTVERANKQPLAGEIAFKEYGITDATVTNLFFLKTTTSAIEGGRIISGGTYEVVRLEPYPNHYEAIVRPVI